MHLFGDSATVMVECHEFKHLLAVTGLKINLNLKDNGINTPTKVSKPPGHFSQIITSNILVSVTQGSHIHLQSPSTIDNDTHTKGSGILWGFFLNQGKI